MLYGEIIAVFSDNRTKHINSTMCGLNVEFLNINPNPANVEYMVSS